MMRNHVSRFDVEHEEKWREIIPQMPFIKFPATWKVAVLPPFGGAVARFQVKLSSKITKSIYLDWFDALGLYGEPYWEVYPYNGDTGRCPVADTKTLLKMIAQRDK